MNFSPTHTAVMVDTKTGKEAGRVELMLTDSGAAFTATEVARGAKESSWCCTKANKLIGRVGGEWFFKNKPITGIANLTISIVAL